MAPAGIGDRVEGLHAVAAAVAAGRVLRLTLEEGRLEDEAVRRLMAVAEEGGAAVDVVDDVSAVAEIDVPQGVVAEAEPIPTLTLEELVPLTDPAALLVLDHLEDPRNVGAIARSALAAGIRALVVPSRRAAPITAVTFKAAAGALERVRVGMVSSVADAVARLREMEVWVVGLAVDGAVSLFGLSVLTEPVALVIGAEGRGLSRLVADRVDVLARIPMAEAAESLNASVAGALAAFEVARARGWVT